MIPPHKLGVCVNGSYNAEEVLELFPDAFVFPAGHPLTGRQFDKIIVIGRPDTALERTNLPGYILGRLRKDGIIVWIGR